MACNGPLGGTTGLTYSAKRATPRTLTDQDLRSILRTAGWIKESALDEASQVVIAESSKQTAVESSNPAGGKNVGIFQIWSGNVPTSKVEWLKDPVFNANVARRMFVANGMRFDTCWETAENWAKGKSEPPDPAKIGDEATNPTDTVSRSVKSGIDAVGDLANALMSREFWERAGFVVMGGVLVTAAVLILASEFMQKVPTPINSAIKSVKQ